MTEKSTINEEIAKYEKAAEEAEKEYKNLLKLAEDKKKAAEKAKKKAAAEKKKMIRKMRMNETSKFSSKLIKKIPGLTKKLDEAEKASDFEKIYDDTIKMIVDSLHTKNDIDSSKSATITDAEKQFLDNVKMLINSFTKDDNLQEDILKALYSFLDAQAHTNTRNWIKVYFEKHGISVTEDEE